MTTKIHSYYDRDDNDSNKDSSIQNPPPLDCNTRLQISIYPYKLLSLTAGQGCKYACIQRTFTFQYIDNYTATSATNSLALQKVRSSPKRWTARHGCKYVLKSETFISRPNFSRLPLVLQRIGFSEVKVGQLQSAFGWHTHVVEAFKS